MGFCFVLFVPGKPEELDDMGEGDLSTNFVGSITVSSPPALELDHKFCLGGEKSTEKKKSVSEEGLATFALTHAGVVLSSVMKILQRARQWKSCCYRCPETQLA